MAAVLGFSVFCSCTEEEIAPKPNNNNGIDGDPITIKTP